jgi:hypothetical protein
MELRPSRLVLLIHINAHKNPPTVAGTAKLQ